MMDAECLTTEVIHCGDALDVLRSFPSWSVQLVYVDPPFNTGRVHKAKAGSFDDRWPSLDHYLAWMRERVVELHRVLKANGSIYVHCDAPASHYVKVFVLDPIFGPANFRNSIHWKRTNAHGSATRRMGHIHDTILFYSRSQRMTWNPPPEAQDSDLWIDIPPLNPQAQERRQWPTQKPQTLLERIVAASSKPGGVVLDPMCGSGTTLAAAAALSRRWVGIDVNPDAVRLATDRLGIAQQQRLAV